MIDVTRGAIATGVAIAAAIALWYGSLGLTDSRAAQLGVLIGVGVIVPLLLYSLRPDWWNG